MPLSPGARLGPYEVVSAIGVGGMGEVYRARDTRLARDVAIKVLPESFANDPDRLARFEREAQLLASLNHPNIAIVHGLEQAGRAGEAGRAGNVDGAGGAAVRALVMELVEGPTLADRIAQGPIPVDEALPIAKQIADALEAAHERGVIHRDLKPANIKVTASGQVKVLDFGLAKLAGPPEGGPYVPGVGAGFNPPDASITPTMTSPAMMTGVGMLVGTPAYMSPEQARGKPVDRRADIWAFGCVLYEMLTGASAFGGEDATELLGAVIHKEPDWTKLPPDTPSSVRRILRRCLTKNVRHRLHDAADLRIEIESVGIESTNEVSSTDRHVHFAGRRYWWAAMLIAVAGATAGAIVDRLLPGSRNAITSNSPLLRTSVVLPRDAPLALGSDIPLGYYSPVIALSPDGASLAYVGRSPSGRILYLRDMTTGEVRSLPGTEDAIRPFFSPDGQWLGFLTTDHVKKVPRQGGTVISLCEADTPVHAWWRQPDQIYFTETETYALSKVSADGGKAQRLMSAGDINVLRFDDVLPDGETVLAESSPSISGDFGDIVRANLRTRQLTTVARSGYAARYVEPGYVLFARASNLMAARLDSGTGAVVGDPITLASDVAMESLFGILHADGSANGVAAYVPGRDLSVGKLAWIDRAGSVEYLDVPERVYGVVDLSPDGTRVAVHVADVKDYIWIWDLIRHEGRRVASQTPEGWPIWSHSGRELAATGPGRVVPYIHDFQPGGAVGEGRPVAGKQGFVAAWFPHDDAIALSTFPRVGIQFVGLRSEVKVPGLEATFVAFSPDGRWLAYVSSQTGIIEIFLRSYPEGRLAGQVSTGGATEPRWEATGLYYRNGREWFSTQVSTQGTEARWDRPQRLFDAEFIDTPGISWDISPDARRLLVVRRTGSITPTTINVITNWLNALPSTAAR